MPAIHIVTGLLAVLIASPSIAADAPVSAPVSKLAQATQPEAAPVARPEGVPSSPATPQPSSEPDKQASPAPTDAGEPTKGAPPSASKADAPVTATQSKPPPKPPSLTVIDAFDAKGILGRDVRSPGSENMGRIADVVVDRAGQVRGVVIDFGGFLGVGQRKIVVDWSALHFWNVADKTASITLDLTREQVRAAPEYKDDQPIVVLGASGTLTPLKFPPITMQER